jgi:hypothetical protein
MRNAGDRYTCSDSSCGCEIEITNPGRAQESAGADSGVTSSERESMDPGSLRAAETQSTSTQGDYGSQGASGEGTFGTSGGGGSSMMSGRYGSKIVHETDKSTPSDRTAAASGDGHISCFCGKPMRRTGIGDQAPFSRTATV